MHRDPVRCRCSARRSARTCAAPSSAIGDARRSSSASQGYRATYRQLWEQTTAVARGLLARGVQQGDRVGIWSPNRFEWVVVQYATARIGAILVNINPAYKTAELRVRARPVRRLAADPARAAFRAGRLRRACSPRCAAACPDAARGARARGRLGRAARAARRRHARRARGARGARCSSTTRSTSSTRPARRASPRARRCRTTTSSTTASSSARRCDYTEHDRVCIPVPFYHCFGMVLGNLACTSHGACMVVPGEAFDAAAVLEAVAGRALHVALRRADDVHRRARRTRASTSSICRRCAPASWPARRARSR